MLAIHPYWGECSREMKIIPTGHQLRAARSLIGWEQKKLAEAAGLHPGVMNRMEMAGKQRVGGTLKNLKAVIDALEKAGVEITGDGVRLMPRGSRK
jgi:predicted transcriptional regulator